MKLKISTVGTYLIIFTFSFVMQLVFVYQLLKNSKSAIYGTNDDAIISSISSGQLTGKPDAHWVFIQPIMSVPLTWLQNFSNSYNIYILSLVILVAFSLSLILTLTINLRDNNIFTNLLILIFWITITFTIIGWFSLAPTYTGASLIITGAAVALIYAMLNDKNQRQINAYICAVLILLMVGYAIRKESIYIGILLLVPALIFKFKESIKISV